MNGETFENWTGWAELENDPAIFSTLLREWGVPSVRIQEVFELDSLFDMPPDNIFGLVLLSRWTAPEEENKHQLTTAPSDLWFANQISSYSCASVAIMNIINNHPSINLGPELNAFRNQTKNMSPKDRGLALDSFEHVREKHNSFATAIDKLTVDMSLKDDVLKYERKKRVEETATTNGKRRKRRKITMEHDDQVNGFHFIAYAPVLASAWKMDGMEPLPRKIAGTTAEGSWLFAAASDIQSQMASAIADEMEFSVLSLVRRTDTEDQSAEAADMQLAREDWGPFISHLVQLHAEKGDIQDLMR
ncbi:uncharacterized protein HMPREF1541_07532 [Cyphellophora europaea CBS 101466]|uniref:ubiquitinyl hydrolase 1 n=1 Tax=Cyphellophora europaea (strain CBS 101466) TaxID=1220924 RepID=W2RQB9_CYPE1|nr:uncharacterized protein HMPREF1541_07532 [Cyphellophora europaea CBS 101466]ETN37909.1 hypothetical protein HMPREF1541_07532 [Cyphellophora europaea CBS 101466]